MPTIERLTESIRSSRSGNCASLSHDECVGICEAILLDGEDCGEVDVVVDCNPSEAIESLRDFLDVSLEDAEEIFRRANGTNSTGDTSDCSSNDDDDDNNNYDYDDDGNNNSAWSDDSDVSLQSTESDYVQDGECEICERQMRTTRHHLIPKFTWKYMKARLVSGASSYKKGDMETFKTTLDMGFTEHDTVDNHEFLHALSSSVPSAEMARASTVKLFLAHYTADVCSKCHSCIHRHIDNDTLAQSYYTVGKLLEHREVYKFSRWAHKQRPGTYKK
eukprot:CAMPEP_0197244668 /NCGR_PEP_ID=MMETSP1429-20130617/9719_1 /TAXON_ID=49237 /ORGANISM="Chaetoceros  sp., Strain UNC1202" /LENGTH=275 /DNA_ID=CAMNT_0042705061 /DNA_START=169 /DNA_END=996 /DNA_ORIENTATION=+